MTAAAQFAETLPGLYRWCLFDYITKIRKRSLSQNI